MSDVKDMIATLVAHDGLGQGAVSAARDWPMRFYSRSLLFSVEARRGFVTPDLAPFPTVIPTFPTVVLAFSTVIPAQAGIQGQVVPSEPSNPGSPPARG